MGEQTNRQWRLIERPVGMVGVEHFAYREEPKPAPQDGEVLVRTLYVSFDPAMRAFLHDRPSYVAPQPIGEVMRAGAIGQVIESRSPQCQPGELVMGAFGWQDYAVANGAQLQKLSAKRPLTDYMSALGGTGLTAYFGVLKVGAAKAGQTVVVSGAAGATGSSAVQIARIIGCRVIGIAGGADKCRFVVEQLGADAAIDYRSENVAARLGDLCPDGIDVYFDNVGGDILDAALANLRRGARVVICGAVAGYNDETLAPGPKRYMSLLVFRATMTGFVVFDYEDRFPEAVAAISEMIADGRLVARETVIDGGVAAFPDALLGLYAGVNTGKLVLKV